MTGEQLRKARAEAGRTQLEAAAQLGVSQTYLSLLEKGRRPLTLSLTRKAARVFGLKPTAIPLREDLWMVPSLTNAQLERELVALRYPGFSHLKPGQPRNPVEVLLAALTADDLDPRLVEALPWVTLEYVDLNWDALKMAAKVRNVQNRLGFVLNVARHLAEDHGMTKKAAVLEAQERELDDARLLKEDTLCHASMTDVEKRWLRENRSAEAKHWRLLTDLSAANLDHVD
jgi:transcriptional regulator with XRE-family HTH domain